MPIYAYNAYRSDGSARKMAGRLVADDERHARQLLRELDLVPVALTEEREREARPPAANWIAAFSRQLGTLLRAGFPMDRALSVLSASSGDAAAKALLVKVDEGVRKGLRLSEAVWRANVPRQSPDAEVRFARIRELTAMIEAGEASGDLPQVLLQYAELLEKRLAFKRRLRGALFYPLTVACIAVGVVIFLFVHVLPTMTKLFAGTRVPLPLPTRVLFGLADAVDMFVWPAAILAAVGIIVIRRAWVSERFRLRVEEMVRRIPWIGTLLEKAAIARWARSFGSLLSNGVDILQALELAGRSAQSYRLKRAVAEARPRVAEGVTLAKAIGETGVFPPLAVEAVIVGENSGALAELLQEMAEAWESEVETSAERFADLLEPLVLVVMGIVVGGIVLAVLLPIFEFNSSIR